MHSVYVVYVQYVQYLRLAQRYCTECSVLYHALCAQYLQYVMPSVDAYSDAGVRITLWVGGSVGWIPLIEFKIQDFRFMSLEDIDAIVKIFKN